MTETIIRVGDESGVVIRDEVLQLTGLKVGDPVEVTVSENGTIRLTPWREELVGRQVTGAAQAARD
jgi:antitoxin component of MazEF toxin-antitoxin module